MKTVEEKALNEIEKQQKEAGIAFLGMIQLEVPEFNAVKNALEKQIPKTVTHEATLYKCCTCPNCKNVVDEFTTFGESRVRVTYKFCHFCGQALDWSDSKTEKGGEEE